MTKKRTKSEKIILSTIGVGFLAFLAVILAVGVIGYATQRREPFEYYGLTVEQLDARIDEMRKEVKTKGDAADALDISQWLPIDRDLVARAIKAYRREKGELPGSLNDLTTSGHLETGALHTIFSITVEGDQWSLSAKRFRDGKPVAVGD